MRYFQIRNQLRLMNRCKRLHGFQLHRQKLCNQQIQAAFSYSMILVVHGDLDLSFKWNLLKLKLYRKSLFIDTLHISGTQSAMNFNGCADHPPG